jgi:hypothetical protein
MSNLKEKDNNKELNNNIKAEEETEELLEQQQKQQIENITSTISETTDQVTDNINEYQEKNKEILEESIDTVNKYQQESINTVQSISNNYIELQKNLLNTFHSVSLKFLDDALNKSYLNNFIYTQEYTDAYYKTNKNITDNTVNATRRINEFILVFIETFNKSIEIAQRYYDNSVLNYVTFLNKIGKSFSNQ